MLSRVVWVVINKDGKILCVFQSVEDAKAWVKENNKLHGGKLRYKAWKLHGT